MCWTVSILEGTHLIPVIYQSGYLTIKDYDSRFRLYTLDYPNQEVEEGFLNYLMLFYTDKSESEAPFEIRKFVSEVEHAKVDGFSVVCRDSLRMLPTR